MTKGKLIVFEGLDKAGKETQSSMLADYFNRVLYREKKIVMNAEVIHFPSYHSMSGHLIREYLDGKQKFSQKTINRIYSVNRYEQRDFMEQWLNAGTILICDRYYYSNMAYGTFDHKYPDSEKYEIERLDSEMSRPDLIIFIDIHPRTSLKRSGKNPDSNEMNYKLQDHARRMYLKIATGEKEWVVVNGEEDKQELHEQIVSIVENKLFK